MSLSLPGILVDSTWLHANLEHPDVRILDATVNLPAPRFDGDYRASSGYDGWLAAHIPGARHADLLTDLADTRASFSFAMPQPDELLKALAALGVSAEKTVVIYDRADGFWAARLWWTLRGIGIESAVLDGGFNAWKQANYPEAVGCAARTTAQTPLSPGAHSAPYGDREQVSTLGQPAEQTVGCAARTTAQRPLSLGAHSAPYVDREQVLAVVEGRAPGILVCALGTGLFDGTAPSRYARRGHIPGSRNLPARTLFDERGRYLPKDALAQVLAAQLHDDTPLILYCGGGISAAANALALTLLGRQHVSIYDGSLQEWAADARLPMTTGAPPA